MKRKWLLFFAFLLLAAAGAAQAQTNVLTYHNDNARTGQILNETNLTLANVNTNTFGLLFSCAVDGQIYAQPLFVAAVTITNKGTHNVVFVATEHDSVFAFDADSDAGSNAAPLWQVTFINPSAGVTTVSSADVNCPDISPEIGITSTPVIDPASMTLYVEARTKEVTATATNYVHRLHALDLGSGAEKFGGPVIIQPVVAGTGDGNDGAGHVPFIGLRQLNRPGLLLANGVVYLAFASLGDIRPYHGWVLGFNAQTLQPQGVFNSTPNGAEAGFWESGDGPATDAAGNIFLISGNGTFDGTTNGDFGDSFIKLTPSGTNLNLTDYFTPCDQQYLSSADLDEGSGGLVVLPDAVGSSAHPHLAVGAGKDGIIHLVDRDALGHFNPSNNNQIVQSLAAINGCWSTPAYFDHTLYYIAQADTPKAFSFSDGLLRTTPSSINGTIFPLRGATPSISANGTRNGIVWALQYASSAVLHAFNATNLARELYNSQQAGLRDALGAPIKFVVPTVANGKVYVGTASALAVFGIASWNTMHGSLQVTIEPSGAVRAGAQWRVDAGTFRNSAATLAHLSVGRHLVSFRPISAWSAPSDQIVTITNGATTSAAGIYVYGNPLLTIASPKSGQSVSNALLLVTGTVKDDVAVESVSYQLNGGSWTLATPSNSWSNWTASVTLNPGANTIRACAQDANGNISPTNEITFTFIPSATLVVLTNGNGAFAPKDNGALLAIGTNYALTAKAGHHWLFSNWVASGSTNFVSNNPVLNFKMQSGLTLTANFVTNVFLEWAVAGTYNGLFAPANAPRQQTNSGAITFTVKTNGVLSGKLTIGTNTPSLAGLFNPAGAVTITTPRKGESSLITTLQLDFASQTVSGTVSNTDGSFVAQVIADLEQKASNYEGHYTLIIPGTNDPTVGPYGTSCGTVTVQAGAVSFVGHLADGTNSVSQTSFVSKDGYWPCYVALYGGHGSLWSWNCFTNTNGAAIIFSTNASWINATNSNKAAVYRSGFTNEQAAIIGSVYTSTNKPLLSLTSGQRTNLQVILEWDDPPYSITNTQITLASNGTITVPDANVIAGNTNKLALAITKTNGVIRGTFVNPSNPRQTNRISGVLLQNRTNAAGYFLGTNRSGTFLLAP
jgi:hypothetical protein